MEFGVLFTSHPNPKEEPYPHREVHQRTTEEILEAERLGYDTAWIAEHHFSTGYGIMPDCFAYMAYLAAKTSRIKLAAGVITLPLYDPIRVVENTSFVDILSNGRVMLGIGSGYRPYEFVGLGNDFDGRRDMVEEAVGLMFDAFHRRRYDHQGKYFSGTVAEPYEMLPQPMQMPHPPLFMAGGTMHQRQTYLVFFGNPDAELPAYPTDLETRGEGFGLDIENDFYKASLSRQMGQLERMSIKRDHGLELFAGGEGHGGGSFGQRERVRDEGAHIELAGENQAGHGGLECRVGGVAAEQILLVHAKAR